MMIGTKTKALIAIIFSLFIGGCYGDITGMGLGGEGGTKPDDYNTVAPGTDEACLGEGISNNSINGDSCEVTSDCKNPLVCVQGECVATMADGIYCDPFDNKACPGINDVCAAGLCTTLPDSCNVTSDCPTDFMCEKVDQQQICIPARESMQCSDVTAGPNLVGTWTLESEMSLIEGIDGFAEDLIDAAQKASDVIEGHWDGNAIEQIFAAFVAVYINEYVPAWALDLIQDVGNIGDVLDNVKVSSTVKIKKTGCKGTYRATQQWDKIIITLRNTPKIIKPADIPYLGPPRADEFSLRYHCGQLYFDKHRIAQTAVGLTRFLLDWVTQQVSSYKDFNEAKKAIVNCDALEDRFMDHMRADCPEGGELDAAVNGRSEEYIECVAWAEVTVGAAVGACDAARDAAVAVFTAKIDREISEEATINLQGVATKVYDNTIDNGVWNGSLENDDFPGTFTMKRTSSN